MESQTVDARGLACPQPVIQTRKALQETDHLTVIVDNDTAQKNVTRMAEKLGHTVQAEARGDGIYLHIRGEETAPVEMTFGKAVPAEGPLVPRRQPGVCDECPERLAEDDALGEALAADDDLVVVALAAGQRAGEREASQHDGAAHGELSPAPCRLRWARTKRPTNSSAGLRCRSSGLPSCTIRPARISTSVSPRKAASARS